MKPFPVVRSTLSRDVRSTLSRDDPPAFYGTVLLPHLDSHK
jgi:hypothetical protein